MRGVPGSKAPHGTLTRYVYHGCRCDECRAAIRDYYRAKRGYRPSDVVRVEREAPHGSENRARRCDCDECKGVAAAARKARRYKNIEATRAYDRAYKAKRRACTTTSRAPGHRAGAAEGDAQAIQRDEATSAAELDGAA